MSKTDRRRRVTRAAAPRERHPMRQPPARLVANLFYAMFVVAITAMGIASAAAVLDLRLSELLSMLAAA